MVHGGSGSDTQEGIGGKCMRVDPPPPFRQSRQPQGGGLVEARHDGAGAPRDTLSRISRLWLQGLVILQRLQPVARPECDTTRRLPCSRKEP